MPLTTNTITRYDATRTVREDLSNIIYNIAPVDVPFMSNAGRDTAKQTLFEWQTDTLAAPANVPVIEGDDVHNVADLRANTQRVNNFTQINRKIVEVSGTVEAVDKAGMKSALAYNLAKAASEMKRDMELGALGLQIGNIGTNAVARATAGLGAWIVTNWMGGAGAGAAPVMSGNAGGNPLDGSPSTAPVAGTARAFTEALLKTAMQKVWTEGGDPKIAFMNASQKIAFSAFAGIATRFRDVPAGKQAQVIGAADVYIGDFGTLSVCPDRFMPVSAVYVGDPEYASISYLRNFKTEVLAKTGDNEKRMILAEWGLRVRAQRSWASILDLS